MKKSFLLLASVLLIFLALIIQGPLQTPAGASQIAPAGTSLLPEGTPPDKNDKDKEKEKNQTNYKKYLENSQELGFSPSPKLFSTVHGLLNSMFYGSANQAKLLESTEAEVNRLLKDATITPTIQNQAFASPEEYLEKALTQYGGSLSRDLITYAALTGLIKGSEDPYTVYMTPKEYNLLKEQMQSAAFGGIGTYIELDTENSNWLTIIEAIEGTPAQKAGLKAGDVIAEIDGKSTKGFSIDMAVSKLRGLKGSPVTVTINRKGTNGSLKFTLVRESIQVKSVSHKIIDNNMGYVRLRLFGENTAQELQEALRDLQAQNVKGIVLDLRNNGGGYINAAVDISSIFIKNGEPVVQVKDKTGNSKVHSARGELKTDLPLVILVNKYSASASEITAGALKDYKRGILLGTKTFGKGSVQQLLPFPDGSALKITVSHYYTPLGNDIDKKGLEPDYKVDMEPREVGKDKDPQLEKALLLLRGNQHTQR
jgi:carboxyl-terminal processing protease